MPSEQNPQRAYDAAWRAIRRSLADGRIALIAALALAWLNFLLTAKWASLPGALNGWKRPWYALALAAATLAAIGSRRLGEAVRLGAWAKAALLIGAAVLAVGFFSSFPVSVWNQVPFFDDWPPRFQSTIDGIELLGRGAVSGWQWAFLGGYHTSSDLTQSLTMLAFAPVKLLGARVGFHVLHLLLFAAVPVMLFWDVRRDRPGDADLAPLTAALGAVFLTGFFGTIVPSGSTNAVAGMACVVLALVGSGAAARGSRAGSVVLVLGLTLALYSHGAFYVYGAVYLAVEAAYYRDLRMAARSAMALVVALVAALPVLWELFAYPAYFRTNNLSFQPLPLDWAALARQIYYACEMLVQPHRWFNDYVGLTYVWLPVVIYVAVTAGRRVGFYAWASLATVAMLRLNSPQFGFLFAREMHMTPVFAAPVLAYVVLRRSGARWVATALLAVAGLYVQASFKPVWHEPSARAYNPALVDHLAALDGNLVLVEGNPHFNMNAHPGQRTVRSAFNSHFDALLPVETGRRIYGQMWDGWHWSAFRERQVAGGAFRGAAIADTSPPEFAREMEKWGIRHLLVWSQPTRDYLASSDRFRRDWEAGAWIGFELIDADTRSVTVAHGRGDLKDPDWLSATIELDGVTAGDVVVVRTNYYPAWSAQMGSQPVPLFAEDGQLAFHAPASGTYSVVLRYPRRTLLLVVALAALVCGAVLLSMAFVLPNRQPGAR